MRDFALLRFALRAMHELGDGSARQVPIDRHHHGWHAGPQPLNGQAIQDLLADGWLRQSAENGTLRIDAWPSFARPTPNQWRAG